MVVETPSAPMLDLAALREDFPILRRRINGRPLVYLDNAATSQKPRQVLDTLIHFYEHSNANIHRGVHTLGAEATGAYERTRSLAADLIGAASSDEIIFTRNTTEAINLVAYTWARETLRPGDEIVVTRLEHHSNLVPWLRLAQEREAVLRVIELTPDGRLDLDPLDELLTERTKLVAVGHASNVLGTIAPVAALAQRAHAVGARLLVDAAQSVPHQPVNVQELGCDFLAFSAHKMLGPTGVGVLWARQELLEAMPPFLGGGSMIGRVTLDRVTWNVLPYKLEAGTPNIADVVAFGTAIEYLQQVGMAAVRAHERDLLAYALEQLADRPELELYGPTDLDQRGGVISFNVRGVHSHDVSTILDEQAIAVRAGHHCTQPLHDWLDVAGSTRASFYLYNTPADVDALVSGLDRVKEVFHRAIGRAL